MIAAVFNDPKQFYRQHKSWILSIGCALLLTTINSIAHSSKSDADLGQTTETKESLDTYIPDGFVLVPVEVENYENLDQILGNFGTIDVYEKVQNGAQTRSRLVGRGLKALRPQNNDKQIGLLVPESEASLVVGTQGPLYVTIHNRQKTGTEIVTPRHKTNRIIYTE